MHCGVKVMRSSYRRRDAAAGASSSSWFGGGGGFFGGGGEAAEERFEFVDGLGDLDVCNGVFAPTREYPDGIYHYHCTIEPEPLLGGGDGDDDAAAVVPAFPYVLARYRGAPELRNFGPHVMHEIGGHADYAQHPPPPGAGPGWF